MSARTITLTVQGVWDAGNTGGAKGLLRDLHAEQEKLAKQTATTVKRESKGVEAQLEADRKKSLALTTSTDRAIERSAKAVSDYKVREAKRAANEFVASLKRDEQAAAASSKKIESYFSQAFKGGFVGGLVGTLTAQLASIPGKIFGGLQTSFEKAMNFRQMELSLAQFSGGADAAKAKIQELIKVSAETPGLSFLSAVDGQKRLQAVGFSADIATKILVGMSKVRVLSGSTKEDLDAMVINLIQIASGGQKATQEIREMATRMPYLVGIIKKEFGGIGQELNEIDPKVFVERLANAAATTEVSFASSSLAVENLQDAFDRLYIAVGSVIEQNPEVIAMLQVLTKEVAGNSDELMKNESQTRSTFSTWVSWTARAGIAVTNFADEAQADVKALIAFLAAAALGYGAYMMRLLSAFPTAINKTIIEPVNFAIAQLKKLPGFLGIGGADIGEIPLLPTGEGLANQMGRAAQLSWNDVSNSDAKKRSADRWQEFESQMVTLRGETEKRQTSEWSKSVMDSLRKNSGLSDEKSKVANAGGGTGRVRNSGNSDDRTSQQIADVATALGFNVGSLRRGNLNAGSLHASGKALDISIRGKSDDQVAELIAALLKKGFRVVDERKKVPGVYQTGPHIHAEANNRKESLIGWDPSLKYGKIPVAMLRQLDAERFSKARGGIDQGDISQFMSQQSDALTKENREKMVRQMVEFYKLTGLIPDKSLIDDIQRLMVEEARQAGVAQPDKQAVLRLFQENANSRLRPIESSGSTTVSGSVQLQPMTLLPGEQYIKNLRISLGLERESTEELSRGAQLLARKSVYEQEILTRLQDQRDTREEDVHNLNIEIELLRRMDVMAEAFRRAKSDELNIGREIRDIQIEIINLGRNDALDRERDRLNDILTIEKSRLELNRAMEISQERIVAGVYEHMASQKTLNQGIVDGINGTYDAILKRMNEPLDKLNNKTGGLLSIVTEPLKAMQGQRLSSIFTGMMDKIFPGVGSQMEKAKNPVVGELKDHTKLLEQIAKNTGGMPIGYKPTTGGIGSILGGFGIGGGSGTGSGGTPPFNPTFGGGQTGNPLDGINIGSGGFNPTTGQYSNPSGSGGGGLGGILSGLGGGLGGLFKGRKNLLTGIVSGMAGKLGGIGDIASMAGGMIGGRWGNLISMAGMGASIGANFGPWGAAIGAGIGGVAGLVMALMGGDSANKKIKEAALSQYGITVKDKQVLGSIKQIGEQYFGKGKVGENATQLVQTDEVKNILRNYAEATGQSGTKIDILSHGDENWSGNQFRGRFGGFRAMGGPVNAGMAYIVGERRPELFVPHSNGTIMPAVPNTTTTNGADTNQIAMLAESVAMLSEQVGRLQTVSAGKLLQMGVDENPKAVRDGYERELHSDPRSTRSLNELTGAII